MELKRNVKIKWTDRITKDEAFQGVKEDGLLQKILKNGRHLSVLLAQYCADDKM